MTVIINENDIQLPELLSAPSAPADEGSLIFYIDSSGSPNIINSGGSPIDVSGSASVLNGMSDVTITTPSNGHLLRYRTSEWVNEAFPATPTTLNDLSDVSASSKTNGDVLVRIGGSYESNVFQPAILAINTTSQDFSSKPSTGTTGLLVVNSSADGNVTNEGDTAQDLLSTNYFQNFNNGTSDDVGVYELSYYVETAHAFSSSMSIYLAEIDTGVRTNLEELDRRSISTTVNEYWCGTAFVNPIAGREYAIGLSTPSSTTLVQFRCLWRKLGHAIS